MAVVLVLDVVSEEEAKVVMVLELQDLVFEVEVKLVMGLVLKLALEVVFVHPLRCPDAVASQLGVQA